MRDGKKLVISFRVSEETYEKLEKYAGSHGESVTSLARKVVEEFAAGGGQSRPLPEPGPEPPEPQPGPEPGHSPENSEEFLELSERVKKLEEQSVAVFGYLGDLHKKLEEYHRQVSQVLGMIGGISPPPLPIIPKPPPVQLPPSPWAMAKRAKRPGKKVKK